MDVACFRLKLSHIMGGVVFLVFISHWKKLIIDRQLIIFSVLLSLSILVSSAFSVYPLKSALYSLVWLFTFVVYFIFPLNLMRVYEPFQLTRICLYAYGLLGSYALLQVIFSVAGIILPFSVQTLIYVRGSAFAQEPSFYAMYAIPIVSFLNVRFLLIRGFEKKMINQDLYPSKLASWPRDEFKAPNLEVHKRHSINAILRVHLGIFRSRKRMIIFTIASNLFLLASTSSTAILSYFVLFSLFLLIKVKEGAQFYTAYLRRNMLKLFCVVMGLLLVSYPVLADFMKVSFFKFLFIGLEIDSFQVRWNGILNAISVFLDYPLFGVGLGSAGSYLYGQTFFPHYLGSIEDIDRVTLEAFDPTNVLTELLS